MFECVASVQFKFKLGKDDALAHRTVRGVLRPQPYVVTLQSESPRLVIGILAQLRVNEAYNSLFILK